MPASKRSHVLALLRASLNLKQTELAELVNCSTATIQSIELNRLALSESLAARISAATGIDLDWLRANDISKPVPPIRVLTVQSKWIEAFRKLFKHAGMTVRESERDALALYIGWELDRLKSIRYELTPEEEQSLKEFERRHAEAEQLTPEMEQEIEEAERRYEEAELKREKEPAAKLRQIPKKKPKASGSGKALALPPPAPRRTRRSA
jgi:transcriptional regulator with XRE-family HTH domain